ncbi:hypothetical protein NC651_010081 [Populus alba x Populus x berolinensis]|nr:hypothetical protein NC651_010081 [Populus alba x Populus x berolinensis]
MTKPTDSFGWPLANDRSWNNNRSQELLTLLLSHKYTRMVKYSDTIILSHFIHITIYWPACTVDNRLQAAVPGCPELINPARVGCFRGRPHPYGTQQATTLARPASTGSVCELVQLRHQVSFLYS